VVGGDEQREEGKDGDGDDHWASWIATPGCARLAMTEKEGARWIAALDFVQLAMTARERRR